MKRVYIYIKWTFMFLGIFYLAKGLLISDIIALLIGYVGIVGFFSFEEIINKLRDFYLNNKHFFNIKEFKRVYTNVFQRTNDYSIFVYKNIKIYYKGHLIDQHVRITLDADWEIHKDFYSRVSQHLVPDGQILIQENKFGSNKDIFIPMLEKEFEYVNVFPCEVSPKIYYFLARKLNDEPTRRNMDNPE